MEKLKDEIGLGFNEKYLSLKITPKSTLQMLGFEDDIINKIKSSKSGYMWVKKKDGKTDIPHEHEGWCGIFGEGLTCLVNESFKWFYTSKVESIDWENNTFKTTNSTYEFKFKEYDTQELLDYLNNEAKFKVIDDGN